MRSGTTTPPVRRVDVAAPDDLRRRRRARRALVRRNRRRARAAAAAARRDDRHRRAALAGFTPAELLSIVVVLAALAAAAGLAVGRVGRTASESARDEMAAELARAQAAHYEASGVYAVERALVEGGFLAAESAELDIVLSPSADEYTIVTARPGSARADSGELDGPGDEPTGDGAAGDDRTVTTPTVRTVIFATGVGGLNARVIDSGGGRVLALVGDDAATAALWERSIRTPPDDTDVVWFRDGVDTATTVEAVLAATDYAVVAAAQPLEGSATAVDAYLTTTGRTHPDDYWSITSTGGPPSASEIADLLDDAGG